MRAEAGATPAELCAVLERLDVLDFPTLLAGWDNGWVDRGAVVAAAVQRLVAELGDPDDELVALAAADDADDEEVRELLARLAERAPQVPAEELRHRWWMAHLEVLVNRGLRPQELSEQGEQLWAQLGYPPELQQLSPYYDGPTPDGQPPDPARAPLDLLTALRSHVAGTGC
ncbi:MAG: DUF2247 family protein [Actinobacteria bacterium]|nr:DUF2247 family protein [Actinomycetota bacterium]MBW3649570.1 DUF2247 family protein [Actinomycetota bacterium]